MPATNGKTELAKKEQRRSVNRAARSRRQGPPGGDFHVRRGDATPTFPTLALVRGDADRVVPIVPAQTDDDTPRRKAVRFPGVGHEALVIYGFDAHGYPWCKMEFDLATVPRELIEFYERSIQQWSEKHY